MVPNCTKRHHYFRYRKNLVTEDIFEFLNKSFNIIYYLMTFSVKLFPAQKINFSIKTFLSNSHQIRSFLWIWSHLLKKVLMENFIFCAMILR